MQSEERLEVCMRRGLFAILAAGALLATAPAAEAFDITPSTGDLDVTRWEDQPPTTNDTKDVLPEATLECGCDISKATELYKDDGGSNDGTETIDEDYAGQVYLLVKDGNHFPAWYLFDLTGLGWNGTDTLDLSGFWPDNGDISHVALYGGTVSTPEPATLSLLAFGLFGLGAVRRKAVAVV